MQQRGYTSGVRCLIAMMAIAAGAGCGDRGSPRRVDPEPEPVAAAGLDAAAPAESTDAAPDPAPPATLDEALAALRAADYSGAADAIAARVAQRERKFALTEADGLACARYLLDSNSPSIRALHEVMPRSTVELVRATRERDVPAAEADRIADFLVGYVADKRFARLDSFDRNHAHVTGRAFPNIDYSGERMTWQGQHKYWSRRGVPDFKTADHIRAYMRQAETMAHFDRVYRPR